MKDWFPYLAGTCPSSLNGIASAVSLITGVVGKALKFAQPGFELEVRGSRGAFNFEHATFETIVLNPETTE